MKSRNTQSGIALVITLILLSVITFLAVTFLAVSRRERATVSAVSNLTDSRLMADAARARAMSEIVALVMARSNFNALDIVVSTNYSNPLGFDPAWGASVTNVGYFDTGGNLLTGADFLRNVANLYYDARPPVFIRTNSNLTLPLDFRYFLDLNRNVFYDPPGTLVETNAFGSVTNAFFGDPNWIGVTEKTGVPHSPTNKFTGRYAFFALPAGHALDVNYLHNQVKHLNQPGLPVFEDGFRRSMGFGTWEINLAAFFRDLNTNVWDYGYSLDPAVSSVGRAFEDATSILTNRYLGNYNTLASVQDLFGNRGAAEFRTDGIDGYADDAVLMTNYFPVGLDNDDPARPWPGADPTNRFVRLQSELFDTNRVSSFLVNRLQLASSGALPGDTNYNQTTFYRLLSQLGTDSAPEKPGKLHLNYSNIGTNKATNFIAWTPLGFFTNAADKMLRERFGNTVAVTNIEIWPTNLYSGAVHQVLQVAANIYDATTNGPAVTAYGAGFPTIYRPLFEVSGSNIFVSGFELFQEPTDLNGLLDFANYLDLNIAADRARLAGAPRSYVLGVPLVIGAKKGFPNFNEFSLQTVAMVARKLEVRKPAITAPPNETNQMYILGISNVFGMEAWNSYATNYPGSLDLHAYVRTSMSLSNEYNVIVWPRLRTALTTNHFTVTNVPLWAAKEFQIPLSTNLLFLTNSVYNPRRVPFFFPLQANNAFERNTDFPVPVWDVHITNSVILAAVDAARGRLVDFANVGSLVTHIDVMRSLVRETAFGQTALISDMWLTNRPGNVPDVEVPTEGIINQMQVSRGDRSVPLSIWNSYSLQPVQGQDKNKAIDGFRVFLGDPPIYTPASQLPPGNISMQAPFAPAIKLYQYSTWQVNDPLVHYHVEDLIDSARIQDRVELKLPSFVITNANLGKLNYRYQPWGGNPEKQADDDAFKLELKDPLVRSSDDWEFPTNKFPNVGWLGRVHRGTPWQTIYLKSTIADQAGWLNWAGNAASHPTNDWRLVDMFTTAPNDNATRGQLSINQSGRAAWSAVLSGVIVLTNVLDELAIRQIPPPPQAQLFAPYVVEPATDPLIRIVDAINVNRALHTNESYSAVSDLLAIPELTVKSPFLNLTGSQPTYGINDAGYERIPQQILSLLRVGDPRYVIYAYGQSLKPAANSIVTTPPYIGMCTNYQITGEMATRTVIRLEGPADNPRAVVESFNVLPPD